MSKIFLTAVKSIGQMTIVWNVSQSFTIPYYNHRSKPLQFPTGVLQGSILGPLSLHISDLPSVCPEVETLMYAGDTVLLVHGRTKADVTAKLTRSQHG